MIPSPVKLKQKETVKQGLEFRPSLQGIPLVFNGIGLGDEVISHRMLTIFLVLRINALSDLYAPTAKSVMMNDYKFIFDDFRYVWVYDKNLVMIEMICHEIHFIWISNKAFPCLLTCKYIRFAFFYRQYLEITPILRRYLVKFIFIILFYPQFTKSN